MSKERDTLKVGVVLHNETNHRLDKEASSFNKPGLKSICVESALIRWFRASREERESDVSEVLNAEVTGSIHQLVEDKNPTTDVKPLRVAAKPAKGVKATPTRKPKA